MKNSSRIKVDPALSIKEVLTSLHVERGVK
jgi:hypothetical protein